MAHRSLLDPVARDMTPDDGDEGSPLGLHRSYRRAMAREFGRDGGRAPSFAECLQGMIGSVRSDGDGTRSMIDETLRRAHYAPTGHRNYRTPGYLGLPEALGVRRTGTEGLSGGATYGFLVHPSYATTVADRARNAYWPGAFVNWWEVPAGSREYRLPITSESAPTIAAQLGGLAPNQFGHGELVLGSLKADGAIAQKTFTQDRLVLYTTVSEDVWKDAADLGRWFHYAALTGFRNAVEACIIQGLPSGLGPGGIVGNRATVTVTRKTASQINEQDVDQLYQGIASQCQDNVYWFTSKPGMQAIRKIVWTTGTRPPLEFPFHWCPEDPTCTPTLYGRPLIQSPFCSAVGTPGDLVAVDLSQYVITWIRPRRSDTNGVATPAGALELSFGSEADAMHRGFVGLPDGAAEFRASDQLLFDTDRLAVAIKARMGGGFIWANTATENGVTVGPASCLST